MSRPEGGPLSLISGDESRLVAQAWLGSRLLILIAGVVLALQQGTSLMAAANHWDAELYGRVATQGYLPEPNLMAFFPGLPVLMAGGHLLGIPTVIVGMVISIAASGFAAVALMRLADQSSDGGTRSGYGHWVAIAWLFAPTAVFTVVPYTESIFCAAAFWAWERARARDWRAAALLAAVAASVRVSGVFLILALLVLAITQARESARRPTTGGVATSGRGLGPIAWGQCVRAVAWLVVPGLVVLAYFGYLYAITGDPLAWFHAQQNGWVRGFTWPWQSAINTWDVIRPGAYPDNPWWPPVFRMEVVSMALGVLATGWCLGRRRWAEAVWIGIQVLAFSTSYWFYSVNRATLLWFPLWIMLVELATLRLNRPTPRMVHRALVVAAVVGMVIAMVWWCWLFFTGNWAS